MALLMNGSTEYHWCETYPLPILKMAVLQDGQVPLTAGLPFFMVYGLEPLISRLSRHFTQYPIVIQVIGLRFY